MDVIRALRIPSAVRRKGFIIQYVTDGFSLNWDKLALTPVVSCDKVSQHQGWFSKGTRVFGGGHYGDFAGSMITELIARQ